MKHLLISFALLFAFLFSHGQKAPISFGKIAKSDFNLTNCPFDSSADAMVLGEFGESEFKVDPRDNTIYIEHTYHVQIKIFNASAAHLGDVAIKLYVGDEDEKILSLKGNTYNLENGKVVKTKLSKKDEHIEKTSQNWNQFKFSMPNVKDGSIIEYQYIFKTIFFGRLPGWNFQKQIPVRYSEYRVAILKYYTYQTIFKGYQPLDVNESKTIYEKFPLQDLHNTASSALDGGGNYSSSTPRSQTEQQYVNVTVHTHRWIAKEMPALEADDFVPNIDDYLTGVDFALISINYPGRAVRRIRDTYETFSKTLLDDIDFGGYLRKSKYLKKDFLPFMGESSERAKAEGVFNKVKSHLAWDEVNSIYGKVSPAEIWRLGTGNVAEINLILTGGLRIVGLSAWPVLLSTRSHGKLHPSYPISGKFNYVVCAVEVDGKMYLIDASSGYHPFGELPFKCLNGDGWLVDETKSRWVNLNANTGFKTSALLKIDLNKPGGYSIDMSYSGYDAYQKRMEKMDESDDDFRSYLNEETPLLKYTKMEIENEKDYTKPFVVQVEAELVNPIQKDEGIIYFEPVLIQRIRENEFKNTERETPVDFGTGIQRSYSLQLVIPDGYVVDEIPKPINLTLPDNAGKFLFMTSILGNKVVVSMQLKLNKTMFLPDQYKVLKEFYDLIIAKQSEPVVLIKQ